jgi:hypothetical protein
MCDGELGEPGGEFVARAAADPDSVDGPSVRSDQSTELAAAVPLKNRQGIFVQPVAGGIVVGVEDFVKLPVQPAGHVVEFVGLLYRLARAARHPPASQAGRTQQPDADVPRLRRPASQPQATAL